MVKIQELDGHLLEKFFSGGCACLVANKEAVNSLNVFPVPDGDTGTNMSLTITSAIRSMAGKESVRDISTALANGALMGARGNSGVILSQIFRGFAGGVSDKEVVNAEDFANALQKGVDLAYRTVMKPVEGTILTVSRQMAAKARECGKPDGDILEFLDEVIAAGQVALDNTPNQLPALKEAGVVDSGGKGLLTIFEGGLRALRGEEFDIKIVEAAKATQTPAGKTVGKAQEDLVYCYCTEFMIHDSIRTPEEVREWLSDKGDCLLVVGVDGIIKTHVHTDNPGNVLAYAISCGSLHDIKIDNMKDEHRESAMEISARENGEFDKPAQVEEEKAEEIEPVGCGVIAVASGEGVAQLFRDLGVTYIVSGGQSMNPSAQDFVDAINAIPSENIVILPNNSNIIMAANQAKDLVDKNVEVLPTKHIPQGLSSMLGYNPDADAKENAEAMAECYEPVKSGQITYAVRDSQTDGIEIKEGEILGLADGKIVASCEDIKEAVMATLEAMVTDEDSLITVIYGEETTEEEANAIVEAISEKYEEMEIELQVGGQAVYYYLLGVE